MNNKIKHVRTVPKLASRPANGHKGTFGHVLVVGGSIGFAGSISLAANGALRGGAGLATFASPASVHATIAGLCPCATSISLECDSSGTVLPSCWRQIIKSQFDVLAVGPGMGLGISQQLLVRAALEQDKPLVLDADGLNNLVAIDNWPSLRNCQLVLTPHPGEFSRLTDKSVQEIQSNRQEQAALAASQWQEKSSTDHPLVLVLKGHHTVVCDGRRIFVNTTGNPGMASGGTGDVLTGMLAALIAQGLQPFEAACLAVHVHGLAGDLGAKDLGQVSLMATDMLDYIPKAFKQLKKGKG